MITTTGTDILDLMQHIVAANPKMNLLTALTEAKAQAGASQPGAHWALTRAAGRPLLQWEADATQTVEAKLELIEKARRLV